MIFLCWCWCHSKNTCEKKFAQITLTLPRRFEGIRVVHVHPDKWASNAGLIPGDEVITVAGQ